MNKKQIEKCYHFSLFSSQNKSLAEKITILMADRYELLSGEANDELLFQDTFSFLKELKSGKDERNCGVLSRSAAYLFFNQNFSSAEVCQILGEGEGRIIPLIELEKEKIMTSDNPKGLNS